jgi:hypothetical protein
VTEGEQEGGSFHVLTLNLLLRENFPIVEYKVINWMYGNDATVISGLFWR